jgi:uncharacterized protein DUF3179
MSASLRISIVAIAIGLPAAHAGKSLPYVTIDHPEFIPASQASFLGDTDRLIGISDGDVVKAYPAAILAQHGVVQDRSPSGPIAVTW